MKRVGDRNCKLTRRKTVATVTMGGNLTIGRAAMLKAVFQKALADAERIRLDMSKSKTADPSLPQLVCSLHKTAMTMDKHVEITGSLPDFLISLLKAAGLIRDDCCMEEYTEHCLWRICNK